MSSNIDFLKADGCKIVNSSGNEVHLRGFSFASWLNFENFIIGIPGHETGIRRAVAEVLGDENAQFFFTSFMNCFISEEDFKFVNSLGCNLVRIPFNYRHFESDNNPFEYIEEGFAWIDKAIKWARKYDIYLILDMHAAQGCQSRGFHTDNISGMAFLWEQKMYQDRAIRLWQEIARRYSNEPVIAGYDLINEPSPSHISQLNNFYHSAVESIRKVDNKHILFIEGVNWSTKFEELEHPFDSNVVYSMHFYSPYGMDDKEYPDLCSQNVQCYDREKLKQEYIERAAFMRRHNVPNWFGETSIKFSPRVTETSRMRFLEDLLSIAEEQGDSWSFGIYKDLGKTGIVYVDHDSEWVRRITPVLNIIKMLQCNPFADDSHINKINEVCSDIGEYVKSVIGNLNELLSAEEIAETSQFFLCECIIPQHLQVPFAKQFIGMNKVEIDRMMQSFALKNCNQRSGWINIIKRITKG